MSKLIFQWGIFGVIIWHWLQIYLVSIQPFPLPFGKSPTLTSGYIVSLPEVLAKKTRFIFATDQGNLLVSWYNNSPIIKPGQTWQLTLKINPPRGLHNPGLVDYGRYLRQQQLVGTAYVLGADNHLLKSSPWQSPINLVRYHLKEMLLQGSEHFALRGLFLALIIGDKSLISSDQWTVFWRTGTSHLVAISGLHIGLVAAFVYGFVRRLWPLIGLAVRVPTSQIAWVTSWFAALIYSGLAGFAVPTIRALVMISVLVYAKLWYRNIMGLQAWVFAAIVVILLNPYSLLLPGTWLSFFAVGFLLYAFSARHGTLTGFHKWFYPQWVVFIGLLPITLFWFQQLTFTDLLVNSVAIPVISFMIVPALMINCFILYLSPALGLWCMHLIEWLTTLLWQFMSYFANLPYWGMYLPAPSLITVLCAAVGALLILSPAAMFGRHLGYLFFLPMLLCKPISPAEGQARLIVLDVGQGLSVVVFTHSHVLIYDAGPSYPEGFDAGLSVLWPYLKSQGINHIDRLVISHGDNDHAGGAKTLLANFKIDSIDTSAMNLYPDANDCIAGMHWQWDGVNFQYLAPIDKQTKISNNQSCVLKIDVGDQRILLPGDIEKETEKLLVAKYKKSVAADILIAPHHGSLTSSSWSFVEKVHPKYVVFSTGFGNRFKFPRTAIIERYQLIGAKLYNTAEQGAIEFELIGKGEVPLPKVNQN